MIEDKSVAVSSQYMCDDPCRRMLRYSLYDDWHRTLDKDLYMFDIDCVEVRGDEPVALLETTVLDTRKLSDAHAILDAYKLHREFQHKVMRLMAYRLTVPFYLVGHTLDLKGFIVERTIRKEAGYTERKVMMRGEYLQFLRRM
jgi:hypothetical protein